MLNNAPNSDPCQPSFPDHLWRGAGRAMGAWLFSMAWQDSAAPVLWAADLLEMLVGLPSAYPH